MKIEFHRRVLFPFLFAVHPILFLYAQNVRELHFSDLMGPLVVSLASSLVLYGILLWIFGSKFGAGFVLTVVVFLFFSYGHIYKLTYFFVLRSHVLLLTIWVILLALTIFGVRARGQQWQGATLALNLIAVALLTLSLYQIGSYAFNQRDFASRSVAVQPPVIDLETEAQPDIYYIILDAYARQDRSQEFYGFDNSDFIRALEARGFYVASHSRSNYSLTFLSLTSSLNLRYLNDPDDPTQAQVRAVSLTNFMQQDNTVVQSLDQAGYTTINIASGWGITNYNPFVDVNLSYKGLGEFPTLFLETTLLSAFYDLQNIRRARILYNFE